MEDEILQKRRSLANQRKELSKIQFAEIYPISNRPNREKENVQNHVLDFPVGLDKYSKIEEYSPEKFSHLSPTTNIPGIDVQQWEDELQSAKRVMEMARGGIARTSQSRLQRDQFLKTEGEFLSKIKKRDFS
jgi:hypothetical protein